MSGAAQAFLAHKRIAVAGVSREPKGHGANLVYRRMRERGYVVFPVNPHADAVEGDRCYPDLRSIPGGVDAVVIGTAPSTSVAVARECVALGIGHVWMHRGPGPGSVSEEAVELCEANGVEVIAGGCPLMFGATADLGHRCIGWFLGLAGSLPRGI